MFSLRLYIMLLIQTNLIGQYIFMIGGLIGVIAVVLYIIISIIIYYGKKKRDESE